MLWIASLVTSRTSMISRKENSIGYYFWTVFTKFYTSELFWKISWLCLACVCSKLTVDTANLNLSTLPKLLARMRNSPGTTPAILWLFYYLVMIAQNKGRGIEMRECMLKYTLQGGTTFMQVWISRETLGLFSWVWPGLHLTVCWKMSEVSY